MIRSQDITQRSAAAFPVRSRVLLRGGVASWANQRHDGACRQIRGLQISAAKIFAIIAGENSSARSPSTLTRATLPSRCGSLPKLPTGRTAPASAPSMIGSMADRKRLCPSRCGSSGRSIRNNEAAGKRPVPSVSGNTNREQQRDTTGVTAGETARNFRSDGARTSGSGSGSSVLQIVAESEQRGNSGKPVRARRGLVKAGRHNDRQDAIRVDQPTPSREAASSRRSIAGVGTDRAASASASRPSYYLAPGDPASAQGGERGRSFARTAGIIQGRAACA